MSRSAASALERRVEIPEDWDPALLALLAAVNVAFVLWTFRAALTVLPNTGDEFSALFQARIFASGRLTAPAPAFPQPFLSDYIAVRGGRWFSIYPPGHALLLALGVLAGDATLVPALLSSAALVAAFFVARRAGGRGPAWLAVGLLFVSPSFRFYSASYYSHSTALLATVLCVLFALKFREERGASPRTAAAFAAAAILGLCARPFELFWVLAPVVAWLAAEPGLRRGPWRRFAPAAALVAVVLAAAAAYNARLSGGLFNSVYLSRVNYGGRLAPARNLTPAGLARLARMCADASKWLLALGGYAGGNLKNPVRPDINLAWPVAAAALALGWRDSRATAFDARARRLLLFVAACAVLGHLFYDKEGGRFGERRFYEVSFILCLFVARLYLWAARFLPPAARAGALAVVLFAPSALTFPGTMLTLRENNEKRMDPYLRTQRAGVRDALVFVSDCPEFYPRFYARNDPDLRGNVFAVGGPQDEAAAALLPGRPRYRYFFDWRRRDFVLRPDPGGTFRGP